MKQKTRILKPRPSNVSARISIYHSDTFRPETAATLITRFIHKTPLTLPPYVFCSYCRNVPQVFCNGHSAPWDVFVSVSAGQCVQTDSYYFIWQLAVATSCPLVYRINPVNQPTATTGGGVTSNRLSNKRKTLYSANGNKMYSLTTNCYTVDRGSQFLWNDDTQQTILSTVYSFTDPTGA